MDTQRANSLGLYRDASYCLKLASDSCTNTDDVHTSAILQNIVQSAQLIGQLRAIETDHTRSLALEQLSIKLEKQQHEMLTGVRQTSHNSQESRSSNETKESDQSEPRCAKTAAATGDSSEEHSSSSKCRRLAIEDTIIAKGRLRFHDVAGLDGVKETLKEAIIMPVQYPHLFTGGRTPWKRILLYGPPGTGKSRLAQAVSSEVSATFYCVSSSDLVSSFVGESEKLIRQLFDHATSQEGRSVVFIDEIDSICRQRSSREEEYTRRIKTELLKQMEGADTDQRSNNIFLLCATNCPWELDLAFLRRFQKRIYVPLPDKESRLLLLKMHSVNSGVHMTDVDWMVLADQSNGYSGSDIATAVLEALFRPIRHLQAAVHWKHLPNGKICPCDGDDEDAFQATMSDLPPQDLQPRHVVLDDFLQSLASNGKTVSDIELGKFENFAKSFGQSK